MPLSCLASSRRPSEPIALKTGIGPVRRPNSQAGDDEHLWDPLALQFPRYGDAHAGCEWVDVFAQAVPAHVGTPTAGYGYESGDPFESFLPPALPLGCGVSEEDLRAVVFVTSTTKKGTARSGQEHDSPLLVLTGAEYAAMPFQQLHDRLCTALRGSRPQLVVELLGPHLTTTLVFEDGSTRVAALDNPSTTMPSSSSSSEGRSSNGADHD